MAYYIVFKNDLNHPYFKNSTRKIPQYEIWKEFDENMIFDSPIYEILKYFDTRKEAQAFVRSLKKKKGVINGK